MFYRLPIDVLGNEASLVWGGPKKIIIELECSCYENICSLQ